MHVYVEPRDVRETIVAPLADAFKAIPGPEQLVVTLCNGLGQTTYLLRPLVDRRKAADLIARHWPDALIDPCE